MYSERLRNISDEVHSTFNNLNAIQLNWKPDSKQWSIGQCIHHIIVANDKYLKVIQDSLRKNRKETFWEKYNPLTSYTGKKMISTLGENVQQRYKSPKLFQPSSSNIKETVIDHFIQQQNDLINAFDAVEKDLMPGTVVTSPVASLLTLQLTDVLQLIIGHELRHINQAKRLMNSPGFPK